MTNETEYAILDKYNFISERFTQIAGIPQYLLCLFGTVMNILTFIQPNYGRQPCSLYLLSASICDLIYLSLAPLTNILQYGFYYDWTIKSMVLCKSQSYLVAVFSKISGTLTTLAVIDRYLLSSRDTNKWKYSTRSLAVRYLQLTFVFWFVVSIPNGFCSTRFHRLSNNGQLMCSNPCRDSFCLCIHTIETCLTSGWIAALLMMVFGLLTLRNVRHIHQRSTSESHLIRQINRQLTSMLILQSIKSGLASLPLASFNFYGLITIKVDKSALRQAKENLINQVFYLLFWSNYTSFFFYIYASDIFRDQWIKVMKRFFCCLDRNRQRRHYVETELRKIRM